MKSVRLASLMLSAASLVWCLVAGWSIWTTRVHYAGVDDKATAQETTSAAAERSFSEVSALGPLPLIVPIVLTVTAIYAAWSRRPIVLLVLAGVLLAYAFVTGFSIGGAYVMPGIILLASGALARVAGRTP